jgi:flagellin-like hook-associated protein FlgL
MGDITLSAGVRQNLLSLQNTADLMSVTQNRLATGKKVNSALDNPTNFFTSQSLSVRAGDMSALLDNMTAGIKTLEAADNGLTAITKTIESMQSTTRQARQDRSFQTSNYALNMPTTPVGTEVLSFTGGAFGVATETVPLTTTAVTTPATAGTVSFNFGTTITFDNAGDELNFSVEVDGAGPPVAVTINAQTLTDAGITGGTIDDATEMRAAVTQALTDAGVTGVTVGGTSPAITLTSNTLGATSEIDISAVGVVDAGGANVISNTSGLTALNDLGTPAVSTTTARTVEELVSAINNDVDLKGKVRASNDGGKLRLENLSTQDLEITGFNVSGEITGGASQLDIGGNSVRANLAKQFNELRDQLNKLADDASYNGVNLLRGDLLKLTFNETGTSTIDIQAQDLDGQERPINTQTLNIDFADEIDFDNEAAIDARLESLAGALGVIRSQSSNFGSNLSIVENRTQFTKAMINTLQTGADSLVLADTNEEAANMLALQTRQQLSSTALSLASQADQAVLRLFG